jgi:gamma-glutamyltranspeptidase
VRPKLAKTLRELGEKGLQIFYNGSLAQTIVGELQSMGGMITLEDLKNYT